MPNDRPSWEWAWSPDLHMRRDLAKAHPSRLSFSATPCVHFFRKEKIGSRQFCNWINIEIEQVEFDNNIVHIKIQLESSQLTKSKSQSTTIRSLGAHNIQSYGSRIILQTVTLGICAIFKIFVHQFRF